MLALRKVKNRKFPVIFNRCFIVRFSRFLWRREVSQKLGDSVLANTGTPTIVSWNFVYTAIGELAGSLTSEKIGSIITFGTFPQITAAVIEAVVIAVIILSDALCSLYQIVHEYRLTVSSCSSVIAILSVSDSVPNVLHQSHVQLRVNDGILSKSERDLATWCVTKEKYSVVFGWFVIPNTAGSTTGTTWRFIVRAAKGAKIVPRCSFVNGILARMGQRLSTQFPLVHDLTSNEIVQLGRTRLILS